MPTLTYPPPSTTGARSSDDKTRRRRRSLLTLTALAVALVAAAALLIGRGSDHTYTNVLVATARPGVSSADLLALEGSIVGSDAVADPVTGRWTASDPLTASVVEIPTLIGLSTPPWS